MDERARARLVELDTDETGKLWLNIDGMCAVRIGYVESVRVKVIDREPVRPGRRSVGSRTQVASADYSAEGNAIAQVTESTGQAINREFDAGRTSLRKP